MKVLLTAPPGIGKSTVIDKVVGQFPWTSCGIVAREMLDREGQRCGFTSVNRRGESRQFMSLAKVPGQGVIDGVWDVDVEAINEFVVPEISAHAKADLIYIDEIGRAQMRSPAFVETLRQTLKSNCNVLASIVYDPEPWSLEFKSSPSACLLEVTAANRDRLPEILVAAFRSEPLFKTLPDSKQQLVYRFLKELVDGGELVAARKLFDNALTYVTGDKVHLASTADSVDKYEIVGKTNKHTLEHNRESGRFNCDCDLANGRGVFANQKQTCSHQLSVRLNQG
jgi:nucleoside-triphosphatase